MGNEIMRIIIYGAGAIGSVVGGTLFRHGQEVILIGRKGHVQAINQNGLKLVTPGGSFTIKIPAVTSPDQIEFSSEDVVFLTMKSQNTLEAVKDLQKVIRDVPIFCLQNGVRNEEIVSKYFPRVYGVRLILGAEYNTDGEVVCRRDPPGWLIIGCYPSGTDEICEKVAGVLRSAGIMVSISPDVMPYKWGKLMSNLINAVQAITGSKDSGTQLIIRATREEAYEVARQAGVSWKSEEEALADWPEAIPLINSRNIQNQMSGGFTSTWQSLMRQAGSVETEFLNGEIVRQAKKIGRQAPINEKLVQISQEMAVNREKPGKYSSEQLISLLGLK
jgi:2-dehydropantoate 2-reductase